MEEEGDDFCEAFLGFLLNLAAAKDKAVRFRVCQIVAGVLNALAVDAEISDELYERMEDVMLERLRDKMPLVRAQAARRVLSYAGPRTTASAWCTPFLEDFLSRRISSPTPGWFQSRRASTPFKPI